MAAVTLVGLIAGGHSGIPRYAVMLGRGLDRVSREFPDLRLTLLSGARGAHEIDPRNLSVRLPPRRLEHVSAGPARVALEQALAGRDRSDLLHFFDLSGPVLSPARPFTTTVHDAAVAHAFGPRSYAYKRRLAPWALRRARAAVAVSAFARDEAVRHFGADPARVHVIHSGPGLALANGAANAAPEPAAGRPFLLYVGNLGQNKNLPFLVSAFGKAETQAELVVAGRAAGSLDGLRQAIASSSASGRIRVVPNASDDDLDALYRGAAATVLPSRYEGFGFPPLEAMTRGCPVLASDIPAFREILGDGAMLLPLDDAHAWAQAMERVVTDEGLRDELRGRGAATVTRYSWDETARGLCRLLGDVIRSRSG